MNNRPIGIFDSGMGGLSVLHQAIKVLPNENYIYYADVDNVPYGLKTNEQIKEYVDKAVKYLIAKNVKAVVVACNTATSVTVEDLRKKYDIPIIGIEPAVKPAIKLNKDKRILLIATPVTIREEKLQKLLKEEDKENKVDLKALPNLVKFAENEEFENEEVENYLKYEFFAENEEFENEEVENYLKYEFGDLNLENYSQLILGCTHFNYFKPTFKKIFNNNIDILDGNIGIVNRLKSVLGENELIGNQEKAIIEYYYSGRLVKKRKELDKIARLHKRLEEVHKL